MARRARSSSESGAAGADAPALLDVDGEPLVMHLEPDQLVSETFRPVPRKHFGRLAGLALWGLRVFTLLVGAMVIYTFIANLP